MSHTGTICLVDRCHNTMTCAKKKSYDRSVFQQDHAKNNQDYKVSFSTALCYIYLLLFYNDSKSIDRASLSVHISFSV